jgi:hypothetical protein
MPDVCEFEDADVGEMLIVARAAKGLFPRIEIDPAHAEALCLLALEALRERKIYAAYAKVIAAGPRDGHQRRAVAAEARLTEKRRANAGGDHG